MDDQVEDAFRVDVLHSGEPVCTLAVVGGTVTADDARPVRQNLVIENDEPCMCGTPFTCLADEHDQAVARLSGLVDG